MGINRDGPQNHQIWQISPVSADGWGSNPLQLGHIMTFKVYQKSVFQFFVAFSRDSDPKLTDFLPSNKSLEFGIINEAFVIK